ncbi:MAG: hypothetical protein ABI372_06785 [Ginsengibacter sp.]
MKSGLLHKIKKKIYAILLLKIVVLFFIVFLLDFTVGTLLRKLYFSQESGKLYRTTYALEKTTSDLLIFGSSTANHEYCPQIFEKRLHISAYNAGRDGSSIFYQYAILQGVLKRYTPKIILLNFDLDEFKKNHLSYDRMSSLLPYYETHPEIQSTVKLRSPTENIKLLSKTYPFNSLLFSILVGNADFNKTRRKDFQGFIPLKNVIQKPLDSGYYNKSELDTNKIRVFNLFVRDCIDANVKLYIVCSPLFFKLENSEEFLHLAQNIAKKNGIEFYNFMNDTSIINHPYYFSDVSHMNEVGATFFSNILVDKITLNDF